eukprot:scaffold131467_cov85-Attheya_sp.AAC.2
MSYGLELELEQTVTNALRVATTTQASVCEEQSGSSAESGVCGAELSLFSNTNPSGQTKKQCTGPPFLYILFLKVGKSILASFWLLSKEEERVMKSVTLMIDSKQFSHTSKNAKKSAVSCYIIYIHKWH